MEWGYGPPLVANAAVQPYASLRSYRTKDPGLSTSDPHHIDDPTRGLEKGPSRLVGRPKWLIQPSDQHTGPTCVP
eukprot:scaffold312_cov409-Pavlova_lutheri.AAC.15